MPNAPSIFNYTLGLTIIIGLVFAGFPRLDIWYSSLFIDETRHFPLEHAPFSEVLRKVYIYLMATFSIAVLLAFIGSLTLKNRRVSLKVWIYSVMVILLGPLILVNAIFKTYWGRARPADILQFGGDLTFTPAFWISDQCPVNCSFTSGEGAGIATVAVLIIALSWKNLTPKGKALLLAITLPLAGFGIELRVISGRHFLSDSLLSVLFCTLIAVILYRLLHMDSPLKTVTRANLKMDLRQVFRRAGRD